MLVVAALKRNSKPIVLKQRALIWFLSLQHSWETRLNGQGWLTPLEPAHLSVGGCQVSGSWLVFDCLTQMNDSSLAVI